jgi:hypothetical protein
MTDEEVSAKFRSLAQRALPPQRIEQALNVLWQLDKATDLDSLFGTLKIG